MNELLAGQTHPGQSLIIYSSGELTRIMMNTLRPSSKSSMTLDWSLTRTNVASVTPYWLLWQCTNCWGHQRRPRGDRCNQCVECTNQCGRTQTCLGDVNYLGKLTKVSSITAPMNQLLKSDVVWLWGPDQQSSFTKMKEIVTSTSVLAYYDMQKPTIVSVDANSYGLGAVLLQEHKNGYHPVPFASRTLSDAETRYKIEKESLASVWACDRFARYLSGLDTFWLLTDHKSLVPLIKKQMWTRVRWDVKDFSCI